MHNQTDDFSKEIHDITLHPFAHQILDYWFGSPNSLEYNHERLMWFKQSDETDASIRSQFLSVHANAALGKYDAWALTPLGACALIIVLDQFSRHLYRGTPQAFANDARALTIARQLIKEGKDRQLPTPHHRSFVYLPFEHDESLDSQRESIRLYEELERDTGLTSPLEWAIKHAEIIQRFGRYPHRNHILGRPSRPEEIAFLKEPGSSF